jgi:hypothetical protein
MPRKVRKKTRRIRPKSEEAERYHHDVFLPRMQNVQAKIESTPLTVLVWGPGESDSPLYDQRIEILNALRDTNIDANMSEQLADPSEEWSVQSQEFVQAMAADVIVVLCTSPGSIAEVAGFSNYPEIASKMVVFIDRSHDQSYVAVGPARDVSIFGNVHYYDSPDDLIMGRLVNKALFVIRRYQMVSWYRKHSNGDK